ncbi:MAG: DMT family transporter [Methanobrevibacter sp.]|nr:DMT family transporter [Methanobrevibacter sp.]
MQIKNYWIFLGLLSGLLFGIATPFSKILLFNLNSFQLSGLLYLGSGIVIIPSIIKKIINKSINFNSSNSSNNGNNNINFKETNNFKNNNKNLLKIVLIVLFGGILGPLFLMTGLSHTSASSTAIWLNMELVATAILGIVIFKDYLDKYAFIGLLFTFAAGLIVSWGNGFGDIFSIIFIVLACFSWGIDNKLTSIVDGYSPETITFIKGIFGGGINLCLGMIIAGHFIPWNLLLYGIILGIFSYGISIVLFVSSAQNLGATRSQILFSTASFWGIGFSILLLGEPLTLNLTIATLFLIVGIVITNNLVHTHKHKHLQMEHIHTHSHDDEHHEHNHSSLNDIKEKGSDKNTDKNKKHIHKHIHKEKEHEHKHFPDLHHKHDYE